MGVGYRIINTNQHKWDISGGPAIMYLEHISVTNLSNDLTIWAPTIEISTFVDFELSKIVDFIYNYKTTFTKSKAGGYKHHMVATLENEITSWLDLDFSFIWDYTLYPEETSAGLLPAKNDYQLLIGLGIEF